MGRNPEFDKAEVVARALELFWTHGYEATSIEDLSGHLGIGRASLYNTFGDKRGVLQAALDLYGQASCEALDSFAKRPGKGRAIIDALLSWQGDDAFSERHPRGCFFLAMGSELREEDPRVIGCVREGLDKIESTFHELLRRGQDDGSIPTDLNVRFTARFLAGVMVAVRALARVGGSTEMVAAMLESGRRALE
ncbi:MAG: TetR/AcrR family transcriptional regulator [Burkholderiales bacterium]